MTRNKPWVGAGRTQANAQATDKSSGDIISSETTDTQDITRSTTHNGDTSQHTRFEGAGHTSSQQLPPPNSSSLSEAPTALAEHSIEEVLHLQHPESEQMNEATATMGTNEDKTNNNNNTASEASSSRHEESDDSLDVVTALSKMLTGGLSSGHSTGPFEFLENFGQALAAPFRSDIVPRDPHHKRSTVGRAPHPSSTRQPRSTRPQSPARGHFHASSTNIALEQGQYLVAECRDREGRKRQTRIDLNDCLANTDGRLTWSKGGLFKASARNVVLANNGQTLEARLRSCNGQWKDSSIWLPHRISNSNGELILLTGIFNRGI